MTRLTAIAMSFLLLVACGGGGDGGPAPPAGVGLPDLPARRASAATPVAPGCNGGRASGTVYIDAEVEPFAAVHPANGNHLLTAWQQDRISDGGARALVSATSFDGGASWQRVMHPMSRCGGARAAVAVAVLLPRG